MTTEQSIRLVVPRVQFAPQLEFKNWIFCLNLFSVYSIIFCNDSLLRAFDEEQQKVFKAFIILIIFIIPMLLLGLILWQNNNLKKD